MKKVQWLDYILHWFLVDGREMGTPRKREDKGSKETSKVED